MPHKQDQGSFNRPGKAGLRGLADSWEGEETEVQISEQLEDIGYHSEETLKDGGTLQVVTESLLNDAFSQGVTFHLLN